MKSALVTSGMNEEKRAHLVQMVEAAVRRGIRVIGLTNESGQRVVNRGTELVDAILDKIRELSLELPNLDCFAVADWNAHYRIALSPEQIAAVGNFPWSDATLNSPCPFRPGKMIRETHFAFVGVDTVSIMELQKLNPKEKEPRFYQYGSDAWYCNEEFANEETLKLRWYLMLKDTVPNSENQTFDEQTTMLPKEYEVPSAVAETAKDFLIFKKTGVYVNPNRYARTADLDSARRRVDVGGCSAGGVHVGFWYDGRCVDLGVAASRKFE